MVVIEDEAIVLAGYQMLFESWGYVVIAAQSADEALGMLEGGAIQPGFILADFRLRNGQTGTDAIERVRQAFGPDIPGVVVTGDTTVTVDRLRLAASEGMPILHKPVNGRQLQELLTRSFKS
ncbi:Putative two-component response transcriptional regulator (CheY family) [Magnetospirillum molischianum DSM 120]|uniref:Putative two-component response transcriptional regulator (CheY family) n=1 Tax=Magnetospirillum molischianum DSM 120 TaxID=1150626 RepID=H8FTI8_MAGML|nr:Putative two-component response transcriptional regulator (CheY family) [Magnetospirillum molischianum DSM 120]